MTKRVEYKFSKIDILFYLWALILLIGTLYSPYQLEALFKTMKFIFLAISLIFFTRVFIDDLDDMNRLIKYLFVNSTLTGYLVLVDFISVGMPIERYAAFGEVVQIPLSLLGSITMLLSIILFYYKRINGIAFVLAAFPSATLMAIAGSKGPVVGLGITLLVLLPIYFKKIRLKFAIFLSLAIWGVTRIEFVSNSIDLLMRRFTIADRDMSTTIRLNIFENAVDLFKNNPVFGAGTYQGDYPHNFFLEVMSENGLLLLIVVLCILAVFAFYYVRFILKKSNNYIESIAFSIFICSFISLMFSFTYVDQKYFFLSMGILIAYSQIERKESFKEEQVEINSQQIKKKEKKKYKLVW